jgi:hypothetical protein
LGNTPPSAGSHTPLPVAKLDELLDIAGPFKPAQIVGRGHAHGTVQPKLFEWMTDHYLDLLYKESRYSEFAQTSERLDARVQRIMLRFAKVAERAGLYRLSQTWKVLNQALQADLLPRADAKKEARLTNHRKKLAKQKEEEEREKELLRNDWFEVKKENFEPIKPHPAIRAITAMERESTSGLSTPLARPLPESPTSEPSWKSYNGQGRHEKFRLPPSSLSNSMTMHKPGIDADDEYEPPSPFVDGEASYTSEAGAGAMNIETPQWYNHRPEVAQHHAMMNMQSKQSPHLDYLSGPSTFGPDFRRLDSDDSFPLYSASTDSQPAKFNRSDSDSSGRFAADTSVPSPDKWADSYRKPSSSWESTGTNSEELRQQPNFNHAQSTASSIIMDEAMEASGTIVPDDPPGHHFHGPSTRTQIMTPTNFNYQILASATTEENDPEFIDADFYPNYSTTDASSKLDSPVPWSAAKLLDAVLSFETLTLPDTASALILLLRALLPTESVNHYQASAILSRFHYRLITLQLFSQACLLRNLSAPAYPFVFADAQENVRLSYYCTTCSRALEQTDDHDARLCAKCSQRRGPCIVCRSDDPGYITSLSDDNHFSANSSYSSDSTVWMYCQGCSHGGHAACLRDWHSAAFTDTQGSCALEGCLHDCLPGAHRMRKVEDRRSALLQSSEARMRDRDRVSRDGGSVRNVPGRRSIARAQNQGLSAVRRDWWQVDESRAVEKVRNTLLPTTMEDMDGYGSSSGKKVKVVTPWEEAKSVRWGN